MTNSNIDLAVSSLAFCNQLLLLGAFGFALMAVGLAGAFGYCFGRCWEMKPKLPANAVLPANPSALATPLVQAAQQIGNLEAQLDLQTGPSMTSGAPTVAAAVQIGQGPENNEVLAAVIRRDSEKWKMQNVPEDLKPAYAKYVSQWVDYDVPWVNPASVQPSRLGSRLQSMASGISTAYTTLSEEGEWRPPMTGKESGTSTSYAQMLLADWRINPNQLQFCYNTNGNGELIKLSCRYGPQMNWQRKPSETYKAILDGKIDVAVKAVKVPKGEIPEAAIAQLARQLLSMNSSQHTVHFYGICQTDESVMLVSEFIEGGCMRDGMKRNPVGLQWYQYGKAIARSVAQGLAALHANRIEHKGLKSKSILVRASDNMAKLCGVNNELIMRHTMKSKDKRLASSFEWTAPEVLLGQRHGPASDMFAFGVVLWELVTQEQPIRGALREPRTPEECPAAIRKLMNDCRQRDPTQRPTASEALDIIQQAWNVAPSGAGIPLTVDVTTKDVILERGKPPLSHSTSPDPSRSESRRTNGVQFSHPFSTPAQSPFKQRAPHLAMTSGSSNKDVKELKSARSAALRSMQSAPVDRGMRERIDENLRDSFERMYACNRNVDPAVKKSVPASVRMGSPARYMSREGSRNISPERTEPVSVSLKKPEKENCERSAAHPFTLPHLQPPSHPGNVWDIFMEADALNEAATKLEGFEERVSASTEASFGVRVDESQDTSPETPGTPDTPHFNGPVSHHANRGAQTKDTDHIISHLHTDHGRMPAAQQLPARSSPVDVVIKSESPSFENEASLRDMAFCR